MHEREDIKITFSNTEVPNIVKRLMISSLSHTLEIFKISLIRNTSKKDFQHGDKASSRARKSLTRFIIY